MAGEWELHEGTRKAEKTREGWEKENARKAGRGSEGEEWDGSGPYGLGRQRVREEAGRGSQLARQPASSDLATTA